MVKLSEVKFVSHNKDVKAALTNSLVDGLNLIGFHYANQSKAIAPVDLDNLRPSVEVGEANAEELSVAIGTNVDYGIWIEKGTEKMEAQPFLSPIVEMASSGEAKSMFTSAVKLK